LAELEAAREKLEEEQLALWKEKNLLSKQIKQFMYDKDLVEKEIRN
jgi:hypothetical protein